MFRVFNDKSEIIWNNGKLTGNKKDIAEINNVVNYLKDNDGYIELTVTGPTISKDFIKNPLSAKTIITNHFFQRYKKYNIDGDIPKLPFDSDVIY